MNQVHFAIVLMAACVFLLVPPGTANAVQQVSFPQLVTINQETDLAFDIDNLPLRYLLDTQAVAGSNSRNDILVLANTETPFSSAVPENEAWAAENGGAAVMRLREDGTILWSTSLGLMGYGKNGVLASDGASVYVIYSSPGIQWQNRTLRLVKLSAQSGSILWSKELSAAGGRVNPLSLSANGSVLTFGVRMAGSGLIAGDGSVMIFDSVQSTDQRPSVPGIVPEYDTFAIYQLDANSGTLLDVLGGAKAKSVEASPENRLAPVMSPFIGASAQNPGGSFIVFAVQKYADTSAGPIDNLSNTDATKNDLYMTWISPGDQMMVPVRIHSDGPLNTDIKRFANGDALLHIGYNYGGTNTPQIMRVKPDLTVVWSRTLGMPDRSTFLGKYGRQNSVIAGDKVYVSGYDESSLSILSADTGAPLGLLTLSPEINGTRARFFERMTLETFFFGRNMDISQPGIRRAQLAGFQIVDIPAGQERPTGTLKPVLRPGELTVPDDTDDLVLRPIQVEEETPKSCGVWVRVTDGSRPVANVTVKAADVRDLQKGLAAGISDADGYVAMDVPHAVPVRFTFDTFLARSITTTAGRSGSVGYRIAPTDYTADCLIDITAKPER